jgi:hypothetical protein
MSGKNQHFVPQMLQRGFSVASHPNQVIVYSKERRVFPTNVRNIGSENYFYQDGDDKSVDDLITSYEEHELDRVLKELRNSRNAASVDNAALSKMIGHFETRTRFLRNEFSNVATKLTEEILVWFTKPSFVEKAAIAYFRQNPEKLKSVLEKQLGSLSENQAFLDHFEQNLATIVKQVIKSNPSVVTDFKSLLQRLAPLFAEAAKNGHLEALGQKTDEIEKNRDYTDFDFRVFEYPSGDLILPDTITCFVYRNGIAPIISNPNKPLEILMPLSNKLLLVGVKQDAEKRPVDQIRRMLASCSFEHFVASKDCQENKALVNRIGKNAKLLSHSEISKILLAKKREILEGKIEASPRA